MIRKILSIAIAGSIICGTMAVCAYSKMPEDPEANSDRRSIWKVSPYYLKEQKIYLDIYLGMEDVPLPYIFSIGQVYNVARKYFIMATESYVCRTPKGDCPSNETQESVNCYCLENGEDGYVFRIPKDFPLNNSQENQNENRSDNTNLNNQSLDDREY